jgi:molybdenum cofactor cytidylyltransferase
MICAIVLAAGRSKRMGTQKLLLPWKSKTVIAHVVDEIQRGPIQEVIVVVGQDAQRIKDSLNGVAVTFVANADSAGDMLSSVRCGLRALPADCEAVVVALGDQPSVTAELLAEMVKAFRENRKGIVVPTHQGRHGHPILFDSHFCDDVLNGYDGIGLRGLLDVHGAEVFELPVSTPAVLDDTDTPEDYKRLSI